ncbi:MAG TPA: hypothetical protein VJ276_07340 [Thermoanaerobaculia bacterium]|nr:hypothetical protein [Thermoanaerobaculia bacterium]
MIRLLIALAVALGVLSLPLHATAAGKTLWRLALVCFALALLPSVIVGLLFPARTGTGASHPFLVGVGLLIAMVTAYGVYRLRAWLRQDPAKKQARLLEKTPIEQARRQNDLLAFLNNNQPPSPPQGPTP